MNCDLLNQDTNKCPDCRVYGVHDICPICNGTGVKKYNKSETRMAVRDYLIVNGWNVYPAWAQNMYCLKKGEHPFWVCIVDKGRKPTAEQMIFIKLINNLTLGSTQAIWCDSLEMFIPLFNDLINGYGLPRK